MSLTRSLIKGGTWLTVASMISKLAGMLSLPVVARLVGPAALGIFSIVFSLAQTGQGVCGLGAEVVIHRNGAQYKTRGVEATGRLFGVGLTLVLATSVTAACLVWIFRSFLAEHWLAQPAIAPWLGPAALLIVLQPLGTLPLVFLASLQEFRAYAIRSSTGIVLGTIAIVLLAWKFGLRGAIAGLIFSAVIQIFVSYVIVRPVLRLKGIGLRLDHYWSEGVAILKLGLPYYYANTLLGSLVALPILGLVSRYGGLGQVGFLRVSQSMAAVIGFLPAAVAPAAISFLSASLAETDKAYEQLKLAHLRGVWTLLLVLTCPACMLLPAITRLLFGPGYEGTYVLSWIALWLALLVGVGSALVQYLLVTRKTVRLALFSTMGVILFVASALFLVPRYGAVGFLVAQFIGQLSATPFIAYPAIADLESADLSLLKNLLVITILGFLATLLVGSLGLGLITAVAVSSFSSIMLCALIFFAVLKPGEQGNLKTLLSRGLLYTPLIRRNDSA
jgi:O-antigen/teichoic acid export membrane protein